MPTIVSVCSLFTRQTSCCCLLLWEKTAEEWVCRHVCKLLPVKNGSADNQPTTVAREFQELCPWQQILEDEKIETSVFITIFAENK